MAAAFIYAYAGVRSAAAPGGGQSTAVSFMQPPSLRVIECNGGGTLAAGIFLSPRQTGKLRIDSVACTPRTPFSLLLFKLRSRLNECFILFVFFFLFCEIYSNLKSFTVLFFVIIKRWWWWFLDSKTELFSIDRIYSRKGCFGSFSYFERVNQSSFLNPKRHQLRKKSLNE